MPTTAVSTLKDKVRHTKQKSLENELHWYIEQIVQPELPQIVEALTVCTNLLCQNGPTEKGPAVTLPVSLSKLEWLKGILVRDGEHITKMELQIKERNFNRHVTQVSLARAIHVPQISDARDQIASAVVLLNQAASIFRGAPTSGPEHAEKHGQLTDVFAQLLRALLAAKTALQLPTDPHVVFPSHVIRPEQFEPPLPPAIALDVYLSQNEVCIDLKALHRVTEQPWADIDESGKSYVDHVRDGLSAGKNLEELVSPEASGIMAKLRRHHDPNEYVTRCITYNRSVVMVQLKIDVLCADPMIMSAFTKLDSVEYLVKSFVEGIEKLS